MATLKELFQGEFGHTLKIDNEATASVTTVDPTGTSSIAANVKVVQRLYCNFDESGCFLGYYVAAGVATAELLHGLVSEHLSSLSTLKAGKDMSTSHAAIYTGGPSLTDLPFSGRIIFYVDAILDDALKQQLGALGRSRGVWVQIRDRRYEEFITMYERPLGFISHDSRDKDSLVRELAEKLRRGLCPVWYDEFSLQPGDSLHDSISAGLQSSKKCVVVLSPNFLANPGWGKAEFNAIMNRQFAEGGNVVIPVWHGVTRDEVAAYSAFAVAWA